MNIELNPEDQAKIESLIAQGRFESPTDVISASLDLIQGEDEWTRYAQRKIDEAAEAAHNNDYASDEDVEALFARYQRKSA